MHQYACGKGSPGCGPGHTETEHGHVASAESCGAIDHERDLVKVDRRERYSDAVEEVQPDSLKHVLGYVGEVEKQRPVDEL
jgi:hypothetical protein